MSDLCMYELDDNVWDQFGENDDHIVPLAGDGHGDQFAVPGDSRKKPCQELNVIVRTNDNATKCCNNGKEESYLPTITNTDTMLEKNLWSHTPDNVFPSSDNNSLKELPGLTSDDTGVSHHCFKGGNVDSGGNELYVDSTILDDRCAAGDANVYQYPLNQVSQTDNELSFLDNDHEDKESSDLSYYGWLDIGNFEDVDRMFRSCDSTFGMGSLSNEEELCWLSTSYGTEGSDDALKSDFKFSCAEASPLKSLSDYYEDSKANSEGPSATGDSKESSLTERTMNTRSLDVENTGSGGTSSSLSGLAMKCGHMDNFIPKERMQKKLFKGQHPSKGTRKNDYLENGDRVHPNGNMKQYAEVKHAYEDSSSLSFSFTGIQQHKEGKEPKPIGHVQTRVPFMHHCHSSDHVSICPTLSGAKSESNGHPSPSPKETSYASNMDSSDCHHLEASALTNNKKEENLVSRSFKIENMAIPKPIDDPLSVQMQVLQTENEVEGYSEVGRVSLGFPQELDLSNVQESSSLSSTPNEISLEATSFRQLQQVMDQLDIRTKLCIRDSLYRLAKSAERRHNCGGINGSIGDDVEARTMLAEDTNRCTGFMDMETNTNPIDRSIAHLLFHRPSDPSTVPANTSASL